MRTFLYDTLTQSEELQAFLGGSLETAKDRVIPRRSESTVNVPKPFIVYGLGNSTNEALAEDEDHTAYRQFLQIWFHDEGGSYLQIDAMIEVVKKLLVGQRNTAAMVTNLHWLENSQEFSNETYNTIFRYARFQAIISKGVPVA